MNQKQTNLNNLCLFQLKLVTKQLGRRTLSIIMEYSFSYLLWNENTYEASVSE
jgi:hypothetical protein